MNITPWLSSQSVQRLQQMYRASGCTYLGDNLRGDILRIGQLEYQQILDTVQHAQTLLFDFVQDQLSHQESAKKLLDFLGYSKKFQEMLLEHAELYTFGRFDCYLSEDGRITMSLPQTGFVRGIESVVMDALTSIAQVYPHGVSSVNKDGAHTLAGDIRASISSHMISGDSKVTIDVLYDGDIVLRSEASTIGTLLSLAYPMARVQVRDITEIYDRASITHAWMLYTNTEKMQDITMKLVEQGVKFLNPLRTCILQNPLLIKYFCTLSVGSELLEIFGQSSVASERVCIGVFSTAVGPSGQLYARLQQEGCRDLYIVTGIVQ